MKIHNFHKNVYLGGALLIAAIVGLIMIGSSRADNFAAGSQLTFNGTVNSLYGNVDNLAISDDVSDFVIEHTYYQPREVRSFFSQPLRSITGTITNSVLNTQTIEIYQNEVLLDTVNPNNITIEIWKSSLSPSDIWAASANLAISAPSTDSVRWASNVGDRSYDLVNGPVSFVFAEPVSNWGTISLNTPADKVVAYLTDNIAHFDFYANGNLLPPPDNFSQLCESSPVLSNVYMAFSTGSCLMIRTNFGSTTQNIPARFEVRGEYYGVAISEAPMSGPVSVHFDATGWDNTVKSFDLSGVISQFDLVPENIGGGGNGGPLSALNSVKKNLSAIVLGGEGGFAPASNWSFPRVMATLHQATVWFQSAIGTDTTINLTKGSTDSGQTITVTQNDQIIGSVSGSFLNLAVSEGTICAGDVWVKGNTKKNTASAALAIAAPEACGPILTISSDSGSVQAFLNVGPITSTLSEGAQINNQDYNLITVSALIGEEGQINPFFANFRFSAQTLDFSPPPPATEIADFNTSNYSVTFPVSQTNVSCAETIVEDNHVTCVFASPLSVNDNITATVVSHSFYTGPETAQTFSPSAVVQAFNDVYNVTNLPGLSIFFNERLNTTINAILTINVPAPKDVTVSQNSNQVGAISQVNNVTLRIVSECGPGGLCPGDVVKANSKNMTASTVLAAETSGGYPPADCLQEGQDYVMWPCESMIGQSNDGVIWTPVDPILPSGTVGVPYSQTIRICPGTSNLGNTDAVSIGDISIGALFNNLPPGFSVTYLPIMDAAPVSLDCQNWLISGTTSVSGNYIVTGITNNDFCYSYDPLGNCNTYINKNTSQASWLFTINPETPKDVILSVTSTSPSTGTGTHNLTTNGPAEVVLSTPQSVWNGGAVTLPTPAVKIIVTAVAPGFANFNFIGINDESILDFNGTEVSASFGDVAEFPYSVHNFFYGFAKFVEPRFTPPDTDAPVILNNEATPQTVYIAPFTVSGTVTDSGTGVETFKINGQNVALDDAGSYSIVITLNVGVNTISEVACDKENNCSTNEKIITYIPDQDKDGDLDGDDNCLTTPNPTQADIDNDGQGDECEPFSFSQGGVFVAGDITPHAVGDKVYFWGAQWWKKNKLSSPGTAPSFKGYENTVNPPTCGDIWSTDPGNSSKPPAPTLPDYMAVVVSSKISKKGSVISGDTKEIVIVYTKGSGYVTSSSANPGHEAIGPVVRTLCKI